MNGSQIDSLTLCPLKLLWARGDVELYLKLERQCCILPYFRANICQITCQVHPEYLTTIYKII